MWKHLLFGWLAALTVLTIHGAGNLTRRRYRSCWRPKRGNNMHVSIVPQKSRVNISSNLDSLKRLQKFSDLV